MDSEEPLSLPALADASGATPRTIRYYIAQGLLPAPSGGGPATRYGRGHLDRLRLIRVLQRQHLPLAEIRARLAQLTDDEVARLVATEAPSRPTETAIEYIQNLLAADRPFTGGPGTATRTPAQPTPASAPVPPSAWAPGSRPPSKLRSIFGPPPRSEPLGARAAEPAVRETVAPYAASAGQGAPQSGARSQWERISLDPDIELHVRRPLSRQQNRAVERLVAFGRQLLEEDQR